MPLTLRAATADDYVFITQWIPDALACARWAGPQFPFPFAAHDAAHLLRQAAGASYVLCDGTAVLGFGQYDVRQAGCVHLCRILVAPAARGRGAGKALADMLMRTACLETGAAAATLMVYRDNLAAIAIYSALGFVPVDLIKDGLEAEIEILGERRPARLTFAPLFDADGARMRG